MASGLGGAGPPGVEGIGPQIPGLTNVGGGGFFSPALQFAMAPECDVCSDSRLDLLRMLWGFFQPNEARGAGDDGERTPAPRYRVPVNLKINTSRPTAQHILDRGHGKVWGVDGPANNQNIVKLNEALQVHMKNPNTQMILGRLGYPPRPALHFFDPQTGRLLSTDFGGNVLRGSGFKLSDPQIKYLYEQGWVR